MTGERDGERGRSGTGDRSKSESRVRRLDPATVDRIAAGEVVTRPARVVGELVDNALDAGASRIDVAVDGDGTDRIRVADDGRGMARADAARAVERHATSKLAPDGDPVGVPSLGFRGEALAAIAEAARLEVVTSSGDEVGTRVVVDGTADRGNRSSASDSTDGVSVEPAGRARGTTVLVEDLFATRPARRESLAGANAEFARISSLVADYALANPSVAFTLDHDGSTTLSTPGTDRTDALLGVYDRDTASRSTTVAASVDAPPGGEGDADAVGVEVSATLAYPSITRSSRDHVRVSVNGRPVRNDRLAAAVRDGYGRLLPDGREPVAAVDVSLPPARVDPNVHPAKREVGLRDADAVADAVASVVEDALTGADLRRAADVATDLDGALDPVGADDGSRPGAFADAVPIGTFRDLYVLVEAGDELLVIDGHAAHERVNYERLARAFDGEPVPTAPLDPPATVSLSTDEAAAARAHADDLAALGFETEAFGGGTRRLRTVPAPFGRTADADAFRDALAALVGADPRTARDARDDLLADLACHPSLKRGEFSDLARDDLRGLLDRLGECDRPYACPHGRPTVLSVDEETVAAGFGRDR
ncbi:MULTISPECIES: DNA mismatch repair endonuclease MutL [unclassified Halorubrum]|uniref:DNA mismatch repair endonuclease MutL n=1 Tax=unclassified Halorubrum TaxID=2642239 RepID=UPI000A2D37F4|nr:MULTISPECIES: DNA mismatch repair endonuclease MutL [unclassified Halorubrum]OTE98711.1 DNA mismatch repair protein MutL [Halorubrum sp. SD683]TKX48220.1 DNA mismatch repair endonuclease MutL [Halorubrum sp. SD690R]